MSRYRVIIEINHYVEEVIEAKDEIDLQEQVKELEASARDHASEDVCTDFYCLDCEEEES